MRTRYSTLLRLVRDKHSTSVGDSSDDGIKRIKGASGIDEATNAMGATDHAAGNRAHANEAELRVPSSQLSGPRSRETACSPPTKEHVTIEEDMWLGEWLVQPRLGRIVRRQVVIHLRPRVMDVLLVLAGRPGDVVSFREFVDRAWNSGSVSENTITHCVEELRKSLGETASLPRFVQTIPRRGYRLVGHVRPAASTKANDPVDEAQFLLVAGRLCAFLVEGGNLIGRSADAPICLESVWVSLHHADIAVSGGSAVIEDLGSENGTFMGPRKIDAATPLTHGDVVTIGDLRFEFRNRRGVYSIPARTQAPVTSHQLLYEVDEADPWSYLSGDGFESELLKE
jgi:DNA-binding winged helix-turn-helix (wHTH) protein